MSNYTNHLYAIIYPNQSLIASQLGPSQFGKHYAIGSAKHFKGKVVFIEVDTSLDDGYFPVSEVWKDVVPHEDGSPKRTKYISNYRVLENIPMDKILDMYLVTVDGHGLQLKRSDYTKVNEAGLIRIYQQLNPIQMLVASNLDQREFGRYFTTENRTKGCPKLCYTQVNLDIAAFEKEYLEQNIHTSALPNVPNRRLENCIKELRENPNKKSKTINLASIFEQLQYNRIRHGFWICGEGTMIFYPLPAAKELEAKHYRWFKSAY